MGNQRRASARSILPPFIACSGRQRTTLKGARTCNEIPVFVAVFRARRHGRLRICELARSEPTDPVLNWEDILWAKNLILVRHEVTKQTTSRDHKRYIRSRQERPRYCLHAEGNVVQAGRRLIVQEAEEKEIVRGKTGTIEDWHTLSCVRIRTADVDPLWVISDSYGTKWWHFTP